MTIPAFPAGLPLPIREGYKGSLQRKLKSTKMDDGKTFVRRKYEKQPNQELFQWRFTWDQYALFEAFLKYDCWPNGGYFNMSVVAGSIPRDLRMKKYPDCRFNAESNCWDVSADCEYYKLKPRGLQLAYALPDYVDPDYWDENDDSMLNGYPLYPPSLPTPERGSYSIDRPDAITRSNIEDGKATERERFKDHAIIVKLVYLFDATQYQTWDAFYHDTLYDGIAPFMGPVANGEGEQILRCKFIEITQAVPVGSGYQVTATVETSRMAVMDETTYRTLI